MTEASKDAETALLEEDVSGFNRDKIRAPKGEEIISLEDLKKIKNAKATAAKDQGWARIMSYYSPKLLAAFTFFTAIVNAASFPLLGLIMGKFQFILITARYDPDFIEKRNEWLIYWVILCVVIGLFNGTERTLMGICGENLTYSVRLDLIRGIMYKQLSWFDSESRAPGVLTGVLSEDISLLNGMTTETIIVMMEAVLGLVIGLAFGIYYCW